MTTTSPKMPAHPTVACHLGMHDWTKIRDDEWHVHFKCEHCDHVKADNSAWWEFTAAER